MRFGTLCSGIEAASEAWLPLGWECAYVAEIEPFPCAYLAQRHGATRPRYMPDEKSARALDRRKIEWGSRIPNIGDIGQASIADFPAVDIVGAGLPCQDFSIAGLRASLAGDRGNLSIIGVRLLLELARNGLVRGAVLEQVPDVLNTQDNAWGNILGALVGADDPLEGLEHGGKWPGAGMVEGPRSRIAWRILDAQHFGLAQRRERVWAVVDFGDGPDPAAVLFEPKSLFRHPPARAEAGTRVAALTANGVGTCGADDNQAQGGHLVADTLRNHTRPGSNALTLAFGGNNTSGPIDVATARTASHTASGRQDFETETFIAHTLRADGFDASEDGTGRGTPLVPAAIAFSLRGREGGAMPEVEGGDVVPSLRAADGGSTRPFIAATAVRPITVVEACRLQGFPDLATLIHWPSAHRKPDDLAETVAYLKGHGLTDNEAHALARTPDGPQYRAIGNSWPVPVPAWIGRRIDAVLSQRQVMSPAAEQ